jgi:phosphatidylserine/phosphatidylglycerophosphate/cardiolipin synthase-like enzyme
MRNTADGMVNVRAISGTHVVFLAFNMKKADAKTLMGFAIQRTDLTEDETIWLRGNKSFASARPTAASDDYSSHKQPFQSFQWADYTAKPGYKYRYRIVAMRGVPGKLKELAATEIEIETEKATGGKHEVHFNRGAIASQAFTNQFKGRTLNEAGAAGYEWLGRDLVPALLDYINRAKDASFSLHAAYFELSRPEGKPWSDIVGALLAAKQRGVDVKLVYHAVDDTQGKANLKLIGDDAALNAISTPRRNAKLMHNKFIVLSRNGNPVSVWTGSTNISRNALYGQLNCGHAVNDAKVAQSFLAYWTTLSGDLEADEMKDWVEANNPQPPTATNSDAIIPIFSPHRGKKVFDWWVNLASQRQPLFMTFPFGIVKDFRPVFDKDDGVLRFAMLDKYTNGGNVAAREAVKAEIERIRRFPNIGMALGNHIEVSWIDGWRKEQGGIGVNVNWVHTKFMLIDPLGPSPVTLAGSANFSGASVDANDENMLLIRGDTHVADIYFGEFMRIFAHHRFRESVKRHIEQFGTAAFDSWKPQDLFEDPDKWVPSHFAAGSEYDIKRRYFSGALA